MPLQKGKQHIQSNAKELLSGPIGNARKKAIRTLAKKHGISFEEARRKQARTILQTFM